MTTHSLQCSNPELFGTVSLPEGFCYVPGFIPVAEARALFACLRVQLPWTQHTVKMFGRSLLTPRQVSWHADPGVSYRYSGVRHPPQAWTPGLDLLRERLSESFSHRFNSVLANLYRDGQDSMGWHADDEPELGPQPVIASVSLGGERRFDLRSRSGPSRRVQLTLEDGSLLLMYGFSQRDWQHRIAKTRRHCAPRINLTYRQVIK